MKLISAVLLSCKSALLEFNKSHFNAHTPEPIFNDLGILKFDDIHSVLQLGKFSVFLKKFILTSKV